MKTEATDKSSAAKLTTRVNLSASEHHSSMKVLSKLLLAGSDRAGFLNAEISSPGSSDSGDWVIAQCFRTEEQAKAFAASGERRKIIEELPEGGTVQEQVAPQMNGSTVAASITCSVTPGREKDYCEWLERIQTEQALYPGYGGTYVQRPTPGTGDQWVTLLRFRSPESMENWFTSEPRRTLIEESKQFVQSENIRKMSSSFPGWLSPDPETNVEPDNWKIASLIVLGVHPIVVLQGRFIIPHLSALNPAASSILLNTISVSIITWVLMPVFTRVFRKWLFAPKDNNKVRNDMTYVAIILSLYAIETALLWNL